LIYAELVAIHDEEKQVFPIHSSYQKPLCFPSQSFTDFVLAVVWPFYRTVVALSSDLLETAAFFNWPCF